MNKLSIQEQDVSQQILLVRGERVIIDADLARLYGTTTKALNQAVKRNRARFPEDFMFQLTNPEKAEVVTNCDHLKKIKFSPNLPRVFTEHGAVMAATVLNTSRAVSMSIYIVRAFRNLLAIEKRVDGHDEEIQSLFGILKTLMEPDNLKNKKQIGFKANRKIKGGIN